MSDELGAKPHYEAGPYVHYCEHPGCKKWGSFGFGGGRGDRNLQLRTANLLTVPGQMVP